MAPHTKEVLYLLGLAYNGAHRSDDASRVLQEAVRLPPADARSLVQLGLAYVESRHFDKAVQSFAGAEQIDPLVQDIGLYRGQALLLAGQPGPARDALLKGQKFSQRGTDTRDQLLRTTLQTDTRRQLADLPASARFPGDVQTRPEVSGVQPRRLKIEGHDLHVTAQVSGQFDSNVRIAPTDNVFGLRNQRLGSAGAVLYVRPELLVTKSGPSVLTAAYSALRTVNFDIDGLDFMNQQGSLTVTNLTPRKPGKTGMRPGGSLMVDHSTVDDKDFLDAITINPYLFIEWPSNTETLLYAQLSNREFENDMDGTLPLEERRSGKFRLVGLAQILHSRNEKTSLKIGFQHDEDETDGIDYTYTGNAPLIGLFSNLGHGLSLSIDGRFHTRRYVNDNAIFGGFRRDEERVLDTRISKRLTGSGTEVFVEHLRDRSRSTLALYDFDRQVTSAGVVSRW